jgi:hypothetical protein
MDLKFTLKKKKISKHIYSIVSVGGGKKNQKWVLASWFTQATGEIMQ